MKESFENLQHFTGCCKVKESELVKVKMPDWWAETDHDVFGYTDYKETYCCELRPSVYVWVPEYDYDGYFHMKDLEVINNDRI